MSGRYQEVLKLFDLPHKSYAELTTKNETPMAKDCLRLLYYSSGSIEIDAIDVSNLRRYCSRRNRIGSNRTNVTKTSVQWEFEYKFFL